MQWLLVVIVQFRQMLSDELTMQNAESSTDEGVTAYITQTFLGNCATVCKTVRPMLSDRLWV